MTKSSKTLMWIFFLLSLLFIGLLIILSCYYISDYTNLIQNDTLSGLDRLLFDFFYLIGFLPISVLGLISSLLSVKFATIKSVKIISYIQGIIFIFGIVYSWIIYFH